MDNFFTILYWFFSIYQHESACWTHQKQVYMSSPHPETLSLPFPPFPFRLSQSTDFGCPAPCIKLALVIYFAYGNIYVSTLSSQIIPPSFSPTESKTPMNFLNASLQIILSLALILVVIYQNLHFYNCNLYVTLVAHILLSDYNFYFPSSLFLIP